MSVDSAYKMRALVAAIDRRCPNAVLLPPAIETFDASHDMRTPIRVEVVRKMLTRGYPSILIVLASVLAFPVSAQGPGASVQRGAVIENECKLKYLRNTKSEVARSYIGKSCNFKGLSTDPEGLARQEHTFHECVLEVLPGTEDDRNAIQLANACRERAWSR